jgi:hypothetical protein
MYFHGLPILEDRMLDSSSFSGNMSRLRVESPFGMHVACYI